MSFGKTMLIIAICELTFHYKVDGAKLTPVGIHDVSKQSHERLSSSASLSTKRFLHRIIKRSTNNIQGQSNCTETNVTECKPLLFDQTQSLNTSSWPQANAISTRCTLDYYNQPVFYSNSASTIVRVWDDSMKVWKKIKATVGFFCAKSYFV